MKTHFKPTIWLVFLQCFLTSFTASQFQEVYSTGFSQYGEGGTITNNGVPSYINLPNIVSCSSGLCHTLCLSSTNQTYSVGFCPTGNSGQLGIGSRGAAPLPQLIMNQPRQVVAGARHSIFLDQSGIASTCGSNL
jgi:hypothetical protein